MLGDVLYVSETLPLTVKNNVNIKVEQIKILEP
jgi:hypothetical protein